MNFSYDPDTILILYPLSGVSLLISGRRGDDSANPRNKITRVLEGVSGGAHGFGGGFNS